MSPIVWHILSLLLLFAPRRWPSSPSFWCPHGLQLSRVKVFLTDHMHTRSWIKCKFSFLRLFGWRSREYPFLRGPVQWSIVFFFELVKILRNIPSLASGTSLLSLSLFMGPVLKFHSVGTSLMSEELWHLFSPPMVVSFPGYSFDVE